MEQKQTIIPENVVVMAKAMLQAKKNKEQLYIQQSRRKGISMAISLYLSMTGVGGGAECSRREIQGSMSNREYDLKRDGSGSVSGMNEYVRGWPGRGETDAN